ncbi:MAG: DNA repair exonuclease [Candidatus Cloacimonetes bacterium]|nr:DNA repair exonuclease [Candidatus Cloacimonadota bacterium]
MKITVLSDTHLGFDYPLRSGAGSRHRGEDFYRNLLLVLNQAIREKTDLVIHAGDLFFRSRVPDLLVNRAHEILFEFAESGIPIVLLPGNHERSLLPETFLTRHPGIHLMNHPRILQLELKAGWVVIAGFPCVRAGIRDKFPGILQDLHLEVKGDCLRLLLMHQGIEGAVVGPADFTFRNGPDVIPFRSLPGSYHAIICGHIHRRQIIRKDTGSGTIPVIFPGSTERTSFAEKNEPKGFYEITCSKNDDWRIAGIVFRELPARPMLDLVIPASVRSLEEMHLELARRLEKIDPETIIRIRCEDHLTLKFLNRPFLDRIFPSSIPIQIAYPGKLFSKK